MNRSTTPEFTLGELTWFKASASSENGACVEVTQVPGRLIGVRDSKAPGGAVLILTADTFAAFLGGVKGGELT
ncbi:DUF397 domain-containing protein [Streptomyces sp. NBC_01618]|uniref:DUF397 domain-containing protein n=1 Tax=Streptomyces sp. NBC_01618 TaxID=2975900 RepID=UPI0038700630|nr:DUF397 domain-containing protein [Streptomyces sp. NBC_01618]